ncbi:DUF2071 domain-containing protein [Priestia megaterium]
MLVSFSFALLPRCYDIQQNSEPYFFSVSSNAQRLTKERVKLTYRGISPSYRSREGELAHWLTERYCLFTTHQGNVYRGDLYHDPWELQKGSVK